MNSKREIMINDTRKEWRELGFYYELKDNKWVFIADKKGLLRFAELLRKYGNNPRRNKLSEHDHYGPYMYLKIMTWNTPNIDEETISGSLQDLLRLSQLVESHLSHCKPNDKFVIGADYAPNHKCELEFQIQKDGFDPAQPDPMDWAEKIQD